MKFNPLDWSEVKTNAKVKIEGGYLWLQCSKESALFVEAEGVESLQGVGTSFRLDLPPETSIRLVSPDGTVAYRRSAWSRVVREADAERFTNVDRLPYESGTMAEVTKALRKLQLAERETIKRIRAEAAAQRERREAGIDPSPAPAPEPASAPAAEPEVKA